MKNIWNRIQTSIAAIGGLLGWYLGGLDVFLYTLIAFVVADYVTGVLRAISEKKLSSAIGAHGIAKKVAIFILVGVGHLIDSYVLRGGAALRTAILFFYIANEGLSIIENASALGLPIPQKLRDVLSQLNKREDNENDK
jgi:toxin secretion/phage lysis holin